jgi:hypothetical protein
MEVVCSCLWLWCYENQDGFDSKGCPCSHTCLSFQTLILCSWEDIDDCKNELYNAVDTRKRSMVQLTFYNRPANAE